MSDFVTFAPSVNRYADAESIQQQASFLHSASPKAPSVHDHISFGSLNQTHPSVNSTADYQNAALRQRGGAQMRSAATDYAELTSLRDTRAGENRAVFVRTKMTLRTAQARYPEAVAKMEGFSKDHGLDQLVRVWVSADVSEKTGSSERLKYNASRQNEKIEKITPAVEMTAKEKARDDANSVRAFEAVNGNPAALKARGAPLGGSRFITCFAKYFSGLGEGMGDPAGRGRIAASLAVTSIPLSASLYGILYAFDYGETDKALKASSKKHHKALAAPVNA